MDNLSETPNKHHVKCFLTGTIMNHVMYAGDIVLCCPLIKGLQHLILTSFKYLGHVLTNTLSDADDIKRQIRCLYTRGNMLINRFKMC